MRGGEGLVEVQLNAIETKVAKFHLTQQGVEISPIAAEQTAPPVHQAGNLQDLRVEKAKGIGQGKGQGGDFLIHHGIKALYIEVTVGIGRHHCRLKTAHDGSGRIGNLDIKSLETIMNEEVAALTLTLPNTFGLFDPQILEIAHLVHRRGGLLCGDGANLNSLLGKVKFGDLGFDCVQLNLHKTFATPHGGGGPGAGPVCVNDTLAPFLPSPLVVADGRKFSFDSPPDSIGRLGAAYGNFAVMVRAYAYIRSLGAEGLKEVSENAVLNANYLK